MDCSIEGCIKPVFSGGLCCKHYDEWKLAKAPICSVDGCSTHSHAKGLCNKHYRQELYKPPCIVDGCGRRQQAGGLCTTHYMRKRKYGHLNPTRPADWGGKESHPLHHSYKWMMRKAGEVNIDQAWKDDFWIFVKDMGEKPCPRHTLRRDSEALPYNKENCYWKKPVLEKIEAKSKREYQNKYLRRLREEKPDMFAAIDFRKHYGISLDDYNRMFDNQNGKCLICESKETAKSPATGEPRRLAVDHCHETGKVRGLLCSSCNTSLGGFKDSIKYLKSAIKYLETH